MQSSDIAARYTFAQQLAREAGEFAHTYFRRLDEITVESKGTQDEVSAEAFIRQRIGEAFPGDGILGTAPPALSMPCTPGVCRSPS